MRNIIKFCDRIFYLLNGYKRLQTIILKTKIKMGMFFFLIQTLTKETGC